MPISVIRLTTYEDAEVLGQDDHGLAHREDGPAVIWYDGTVEWYIHGELHRTDGPAIISPGGTEQWHQNGRLHREDGPAITRRNGYWAWYRNSTRHRPDGPANSEGDWFWYGRQLTPYQVKRLEKLTPEQRELACMLFRDGVKIREATTAAALV